MKKAIIIGAGGQVGADLVPLLLKKGYEVNLFDQVSADKTAAYPNLSKIFTLNELEKIWTIGDATGNDLTNFLQAHDASIIFHLAAILSARGESNPDKCWQVNMTSLKAVLDFLSREKYRNDNSPTLIWPSTIAAFGPIPDFVGKMPNPTPNEIPMLPTTMYGITKVAGELLGNYYFQKFGIDFRSVRFPGLINSTPPGGGSSDYASEMYFSSVEGRIANCFVREDTQIPFMYMPDAVRALFEISQASSSSLTRRVYNIASMSPTAKDFENSILKYHPNFKIEYNPDNRQEFVDSWPKALDDSLARRDWGWKPEYDLDKMTSDLLLEIKNSHDS